jgi:Tfp pilus assembly protein PilO
MSKKSTTHLPSAAENLQKKTDHHMMIIAIFLALSMVVWFIIFSLGRSQLDQLDLINKEIKTTFVSDQNLNQLNQFVDANSNTLNRVNQFFPNETNIIETLESIETIVKKYDEGGVVNIVSIQAVPKEGQLHIPLTIVASSSLESLTKLLRELEKLPLILEISSVDLIHTSASALQINLGVNLYVDDPFIPAPTTSAR